MHIKNVEIKNFRGINIKIECLKENFLIIGKNNSGKTNFCKAIQKVLDPQIRKNPLLESDSTNSNKNDISIKIVLDLSEISSNNRSNLGEYIDDSDETKNETITIELLANFNEESQLYEESVYFGTIDKSDAIPTNKFNKLDKVLELVYVKPNYDLNNDTRNFFKYHRIENNKTSNQIGTDIIEKIKNLNNSISSDDIVKSMQDKINDLEGSEIIQDTNFKIESDFEISNIYKSLKITPMNNSNAVSMGDGTSKMLALTLQKLINENEKEKIIILEEPENHLFPLLQKQFISWIESFNFSQIITTTHSPEIIDFRKADEIIKFAMNNSKESILEIYRTNIDKSNIYKDFGYALNKEIAESFFYDKVLLIEGYSEKLFYNTIINNDKKFRKKVFDDSIGFVCVYGVDFSPSMKILNSLGIEVHILTDSDIMKIPHRLNFKRYAGIQRAMDILKNYDEKNISINISDKEWNREDFSVEINSDDNKLLDSKMDEIIKKIEEYNIYLNLDGFEKSVVDFIEPSNDQDNKNDIIKCLKKKKMKNLHKYLLDKIDLLKINNTNKNNILVRFVYEK